MRRLALALIALFSSPALAQNVWVVGDISGPSVDFLNVHNAVAWASDGDVILIRSGSYPNVVINGKSLTLIAEINHNVRIAGMSVRNLAVGQEVVLSRINLEGGTEAGLAVKNSAGSVWVQNCVIAGADGFGDFVFFPNHPDGYPGVELVNAGTVSLSRCVIDGGEAEHWSLSSSPGNGGHGVQVSGSTQLSLHASELRGGQGGHIDDDDTAWDALDGGHGLAVGGGQIQVMGCVLLGGNGGVGGEDFDIFTGWACGNGGDGGDGIGEVFGGGGATVRVATSTLLGGAYGPPYPGSLCSGGFMGQPVDVTSAFVQPFDADSYSLTTTGPHVEGQTIQLNVSGPPNSLGLIVIGTGPTQTAVPVYAGDLLVTAPQPVLLSLGSLPSSTQIVAPQVATVGGFRDFYSQIVGYNPATNRITLSEPLYNVIFDTLAK